MRLGSKCLKQNDFLSRSLDESANSDTPYGLDRFKSGPALSVPAHRNHPTSVLLEEALAAVRRSTTPSRIT